MSDPLSRWQAGATAAQFTPAEAGALAEHLMQRNPAYRDRKHPDNEAISREVGELMRRAHPGHVGAGGEACGGPAPSESFQR